jgi:hypothetical protein
MAGRPFRWKKERQANGGRKWNASGGFLATSLLLGAAGLIRRRQARAA